MESSDTEGIQDAVSQCLTQWCDDLQGNLFQLRDIKVLGRPGTHPLLELAGQATICYVVQDETAVGADNWHEAPRLSLENSDASQTDRAAPHGAIQVMITIWKCIHFGTSLQWMALTLRVPHCTPDELHSLHQCNSK